MKLNIIKIYFLSTLFIISLASCQKETLEPKNEVQNTIEPQQMGGFISTDITGRIEIYTGTSSGTSALIQPSTPHALSVTSSVPMGFLVIGGTAEVIANNADPGSLLTESRPLTGSASFTGWRVSAKAHSAPNAYNWILRSRAIGIRLKDNNGNYIPASVLKQYLKIFTSTSSSASHPTTQVSVTSDYHLISGGAKVNWTGSGNLLTASYPSGSSWIAKGKDHMHLSPSTITSYAIGIKKTIPNFGSLGVVNSSNCSYTSGHADYSILNRNDPNNIALNTGYGAKATYNSSGRMLTDISGWIKSARADSKDHFIVDGGNTCVYSIALKKN